MLFKNILIVCIGNICRSPMAEGLLKQALLSNKKDGYVVCSAGLGALVGHPPDSKACQLMMKKNIDISMYRACQLNKDMIRKAELILVMESSHKKAIEEFDPCAKGKVFRLGYWGEFDIPDPYQQNLSAFETSFNLIERGVSEWVKKL
ncbi:MAG: low molecular weight protein-tyrosine-phosphatase [Methylobacter sp.]